MMEGERTAVENGPTRHDEEEEEEEELPDLDDFTGSSTMAATTLREIKKEMDTSEPMPAMSNQCSEEDTGRSDPEVVNLTSGDEDSVQCLGTQSQDLVIVEEKLSKNPASDPLFDSEDADAELAQYLDDLEKKEARPEQPTDQEKSRVSGRLAKLMGKIPAGLLSKKPVIKSSEKSFIDFEEDPKAYEQTQKGVEKLMKRFQIHTHTSKPKKEEHYKIHITTKEEDSQGIEHLQTGEEEYVKLVPDEEEDEMESPELQAPGVKMGMARARLLAQVRANRAKAMEEKMKNYAMYSEEKDLEDKPDNEQPELLDNDDDESDDDTENEVEEDEVEVDGETEEVGEDCGEEEEEDDEDEIDDGDELPLLNGKKQRKRIKFLEDEADESEGDNGSADEDEAQLDKVRKSDLNFIDDTPLSDDEDMPNAYVHEPSESQLQEYENHQTVSQSDEAFSQELFSEPESQPQAQSEYSAVESSPIPSSISSFLDPNKTPVLTPIFSRKHSNSPFGSLKVNFKSSQPQISPLIPRLNSETALAAFCEDSPCENRPSPAMPAGLSKLIGETTPLTQRGIDDELEGICSARFPSQQPMTPCDSQENASFDFNSDDEKTDSTKDRCNSRNSLALNASSVMLDTPKTTERTGRGTRLNFDQVPVVAVDDQGNQEIGSDDDNEEEVVTPSVRKRKRKRQLKFSDDEDSDAEDKENEVGSNSDEEMDDDAASEEAMQSEVEYDENEEPILKPAIGLVDNKTGKLRREFFEAEAELSGSEAGSDDEDEKNMDYYEKEDGDDEDFDDDEIRKQVEKQYLKQQLDDDEREVRDLQNRYLEDGDLHMDGQMRERKFKWKLENKQWLQGVQVTETDTTDEVEDEAEVKWREAKLEKLKWMKENEKELTVTDEDIEIVSQKLLRTSQVLKLGNTTLRKSKTEVTITEQVSTSEKSPAAFERKGSFLCRETTLTRLAETAKISDSVNTNKPAGTKGFVFQVLTPPSEVANSKKASARNKQEIKNQPKKMLRVDRSFNNLDEAEQSKSIFKFMS